MNGSSRFSSQHDESAMNKDLFRQHNLDIHHSSITASQGSIIRCFIHRIAQHNSSIDMGYLFVCFYKILICLFV